MCSERGMNVVELKKQLADYPENFEVRLGIDAGEGTYDVPLAPENIERDGMLGTVTITPVSEDFGDDDGSEYPAPVLPKPTPKAAPEDTPPAVVPKLEAVQEVTNVVFCRECRRVFIPGKDLRADSVLPCGHTPSVWMLASCIIDGESDAQFVDWLDTNGPMDQALEELARSGGAFHAERLGRGRFVAPTRR